MTAPVAVDNAELKSLGNIYGIEIETVIPVGGGFSGASVLRVEDSSKAAFALRRTPIASAISAERYCEMVTLLRDVASQGCGMIPVPLRHQQASQRILQSPYSPHFLNVDPSQTRLQSHDFVWQMELWKPGEPASGPPTPRQVESTLEALEGFHRTAAESVQARSNAQYFSVNHGTSPGISRRLSIVSELRDGLLADFITATANEIDPAFRDYAERLCAALEYWLPWLTKQLAEIACRSYRLQPVIRDLWRPHVLFTNERVTGIIDLNSLATDHVGLDVTRLLRSWFSSDVARIREVINQFCLQRTLGEHEWKLLQTLDAATVLLSPVTWLRHRFVSSSMECISRPVLDRLADLTTQAQRFEPL